MPGSGVKQRLLKQLNNNLVYPHSNTCTWLHIHFYRKGERSSRVRKCSLLNFFINLIIKPHFCISLSHKRNKTTISVLKVQVTLLYKFIHLVTDLLHSDGTQPQNDPVPGWSLISLEQSEMICLFCSLHEDYFRLQMFIFYIPICPPVFLVCNHVTRQPCWGSKQKNISPKNLHENTV